VIPGRQRGHEILQATLALNVALESSGQRRHQRRKRGCRLVGRKPDLRPEPANGRTVLGIEDSIKDVDAVSPSYLALRPQPLNRGAMHFSGRSEDRAAR
jgi:hypothetical protein